MSRNLVIAIGALLWTAVAVDAFVHVLLGAWIVAVMMAIIGVAWITLRRAQWSPLRSRPGAGPLPE